MRTKTFVYIIIYVVVFILFFIIGRACSQDFLNKPMLELVEVELGAIAPLNSVPVSKIKVFAYADTGYLPVPFQLAEKKAKNILAWLTVSSTTMTS